MDTDLTTLEMIDLISERLLPYDYRVKGAIRLLLTIQRMENGKPLEKANTKETSKRTRRKE